MCGKVTLVGAGPGDPGLLTLKGRRALEQAEVVVYDRLVGREILSWIPETAERIRSGLLPASANAFYQTPTENTGRTE